MSNYIAKSDIPWGGVLAFSRGMTIRAEDAESLKANGLEDFLVGENTKEGREIKADVSGRPVSDFETTSTTRSAKSTSSDSVTSTTAEKG